jgi:RHS repeat-associated protein
LAKITACALNGLCTSDSAWAVLPNDSTPILGFTGRPLEALGRQFGAPFGPGLSVSGAEVETGFGIPAYISRGAARGAGLVYSTRTSYPRALVPVDLELPWPSTAPTQIKLILFDGAVKLDSLVLGSGQTTCASYGGAVKRCRAVLQGDFSGSSYTKPNRKRLTIQAQVTSGSTTKMISDSTEVVLVDRRTTAYGSGWWPSAYVRLDTAGSDRLLVGPSGTAAIYRSNGDSLYLSPPGDFTALVKVGSGWELHPRGTVAKVVFDANGRVQAAVDQNGNRDSIAYSGSTDQVTALVDPVGKSITFTYNSGGKLSRLTDPGSRQSKDSIDASNQLFYDSVTSPTSRPNTRRFVYQSYGTNTFVLTKQIGVILDTTIVTYDSTFKRRPTQVRLAQVQDETGTTVNPVIAYTAYERRGFGALVGLDSTYVQLKDPRNNWSRSLLNRWGQVRKAWDSLGVFGRSEFTADGFARWAEGKVADSSRAYTRYDSQWRPVKSFIIRATGDTLRTDSLVYDASQRVIVRIDARGKKDSVLYDANGNILKTITPNGDVTQFWYETNGLLDSTRLPLAPGLPRKFTYDGTWKNLLTVTDESGTLIATNALDGLGRDTLNESKIRVQVTATSSNWQWRRTQPFFNAAGQLDSSRVIRTNNCADPCNSPSWPGSLDTDSTHVQRVRYKYDRAGRDSLRLNDRNKATWYRYDRLGRVVARYPWTDSSAVRDSFVYDIAGNLKKTITRRGDTITTNYDSRNRDTLNVIPGVGTLRKAFGGPLDQLTRLWYDTPANDSLNVNAELRWGFDQRGRLKADTSYASGTALRTSYVYDHFERDSLHVDTLGTWAMRYETSRGLADTLISPYADTITYTYDGRSRAMGPYLHNAGAIAFSRVPDWNGTGGALEALVDTVQTAPGYVAGRWERTVDVDDPPGTNLSPRWIEQHGTAPHTPVDTLRDSVTYDGWERVLSWVQTKTGGATTVRDTFAFDRAGNLKTTAGAESYDVTTDRLLSMTVGGFAWSFTYDRAGNLIKTIAARSGATDTLVYTYDALNRLRKVQRNGALIARYGYDVLGRRIAKRVYSSSTGGTVAYTRFVYHGQSISLETDSIGAFGLRYTWGLDIDDLVAIRDASGNHFYAVQDKQRSVRGLVKRDGTWMLSQRFRPYGAIAARDTNASGPGFAVRYSWTGREYDAETGWYFFRSRYYDPNVRRMVQEDPAGYGAGKNLYAYGDGAPVEGRDPSGMMYNYDPYGRKMMEADGPRFEDPFGDYGGGSDIINVERDAWELNSFDKFATSTWLQHQWELNPQTHETGNMQFVGDGAEVAYLELKGKAYMAGDADLVDFLSRAEHGKFTLVVGEGMCSGSADFSPGCSNAHDIPGRIAIYIDTYMARIEHQDYLGPSIAHELGHWLPALHPVPEVLHYTSYSEPTAIYYENLARHDYGCTSRPLDYAAHPLPPCPGH